LLERREEGSGSEGEGPLGKAGIVIEIVLRVQGEADGPGSALGAFADWKTERDIGPPGVFPVDDDLEIAGVEGAAVAELVSDDGFDWRGGGIAPEDILAEEATALEFFGAIDDTTEGGAEDESIGGGTGRGGNWRGIPGGRGIGMVILSRHGGRRGPNNGNDQGEGIPGDEGVDERRFHAGV
jgi:hypothetical protein